MRPKFLSATSILMLAAMLYASVGPQICRAAMAGDAVTATVKCCGDGSEPTNDANAPADAHESCPLHKLSLIELLPANGGSQLLEIPQVIADAPFASAPEFNLPVALHYLAFNDSSPPFDPTCSLFLIHRNIRR